MKKNLSALLISLFCFPHFLSATVDDALLNTGDETVTAGQDLVFSKIPVNISLNEDLQKLHKFKTSQIVDGKPVYTLTFFERTSPGEVDFNTNMYYGGSVYEDVPEKSILVNDKVASVVFEEGSRKTFVTIDKQKIGPYDEVIRLYGHNNKAYFYATIGGETYLYNEF